MKTKDIKEIMKFIKENDKSLDIQYYVDEDELKELTDVSEVKEYIERLNDEQQITDEDVIYYSTAIKYLQENDTSLKESMQLASEF